MRCVYLAAFIAGLAAVCSLAVFDSGGGVPAIAAPPEPAEPAAPAEAPKPAAGNADSWSTLKGRLVYAGPTVPERKELKVDKDQPHCLANGPILDREWIVNKENRGVKDVFVWLAVDPTGQLKTLPIHPDLKAAPKEPVVIDQPHCMFEPYSNVMREGQQVIVKNSSPIAHNANYAGSPTKNPGNNSIVPAGQQIAISLKADRMPVRLSCNIHGWMKGFIGVYDHPYFALTDANGNFELKLAPAGQFRLYIWHDPVGWRLGAAGSRGEPVTIKAGQTTDLGKLDIQEPKKD
jgi:hypothetical protein